MGVRERRLSGLLAVLSMLSGRGGGGDTKDILFNNNSRKWICRLVLNDRRKVLILPTAEKKDIKHNLNSLKDLHDYQPQLLEVIERYVQK